MKRFIAFSGGVESTTMCILYGKGAEAIWVDVGVEEKEMYQRIDYCEKKIKEIHQGDFKINRIKPNVKIKGEYVDNLEKAAELKKIFPTKVRRWCTADFKIKPIELFLKQQGDCELMIGFNADEEGRSGDLEKLKNVKYTYPLIEDGYDRDDCIGILNSKELMPNFPVYMQRGGCRWCFFQGKKEMKAKYIFNKEEFLKDMYFEEHINSITTSSEFFPINLSGGSYRQIMEQCDSEIALWGLDAVKDMYTKIVTHEPCGAFCHR